MVIEENTITLVAHISEKQLDGCDEEELKFRNSDEFVERVEKYTNAILENEFLRTGIPFQIFISKYRLVSNASNLPAIELKTYCREQEIPSKYKEKGFEIYSKYYTAIFTRILKQISNLFYDPSVTLSKFGSDSIVINLEDIL